VCVCCKILIKIGDSAVSYFKQAVDSFVDYMTFELTTTVKNNNIQLLVVKFRAVLNPLLSGTGHFQSSPKYSSTFIPWQSA